MDEFKDTLLSALSGCALECAPEAADLLCGYYKLLCAANERMNLTRITSPGEAALMHFFDSLCFLRIRSLSQNTRVIDIGTGAGFPGVPIAALRPFASVTLLDATAKKADFVSRSCESLGINAATVCGRAEELARGPMRGGFDYVLSRAVAPLSALLELCAPFAAVGGEIAAYKGQRWEDELSCAKTAVEALGLTLQTVFETGVGGRVILIFKKEKPTKAQFPRQYSKIKSHPL